MPLPQIDAAVLIALLPAILGLVNFVKSLGVEGKPLTIVSMVVGVVFYLCYALLPAGTFQIILNGVVLGLAASGLYDLASMVSPWKNASVTALPVEDKAATK